MSKAFPNSIREGVPYSPDLDPQGPEMAPDPTPTGCQSQYTPGSNLYDGLPDVPAPHNKGA